MDVIDTAGDIQLRGLDSIIGRSVVIHERGTNANFECGTITTMNELNGTHTHTHTCILHCMHGMHVIPSTFMS